MRAVVCRLKRRRAAATACVMLLIALTPVLSMADLLPPPLPGELPLHRIGYEIVFEALAATAAGTAALRVLVKRRWKLRGEVSADEKAELERKLQAALPQLRKFELEAKNLQSDGSCRFRYDSYYAARFKKELEKQLMDHPEFRRALDGVPIEWAYDALVPKGWSEEDSPWMTKEDAHEMEDSQRARYQRPSEKELMESIARIRMEHERKVNRRRCGWPPSPYWLSLEYLLKWGFALIVVTVLPWLIWLVFSTGKSSSVLGTVLGWIAVIGGGVGAVPWLVQLVLLAVALVRR